MICDLGKCYFPIRQICVNISKRRVYNNLIVSVDGQNVSVYTDENDLIHFESIDSEKIKDLISSNLSIERKRGAV